MAQASLAVAPSLLLLGLLLWSIAAEADSPPPLDPTAPAVAADTPRLYQLLIARYPQWGLALCVSGASLDSTSETAFQFDLSAVEMVWLGVQPSLISFPNNTGLCYNSTRPSDVNFVDLKGYYGFTDVVEGGNVVARIPAEFVDCDSPQVLDVTSVTMSAIAASSLPASSLVSVTALNSMKTPLQVLGLPTDLIAPPAAAYQPGIASLPGTDAGTVDTTSPFSPIVILYLSNHYFANCGNSSCFNTTAPRGAAILYSIPLTSNTDTRINVTYILHKPVSGSDNGFEYLQFDASYYVTASQSSRGLLEGHGPRKVAPRGRLLQDTTLGTLSTDYVYMPEGSKCIQIIPTPPYCAPNLPTWPMCRYKCS